MLPFDEQQVLYVLQSITEVSVAFIITNPFLFKQDYEFELDQQTIDQLNILNPTDALVYSILTIVEPFERTTANLKAPIIMNQHNNRGKQMILQEEPYDTKYSLIKGCE
ncbi:flagellar assembly protein FliW [Bacillus carboniphilus]|uniref:Flagellar assembly protein FliW n=1 Tax=Bacillus carboniphilus TaxID=86663 RepID=A0ABY9JSL7_9BACI|nr:flagellar assembly protein FliW [Bacillus carboniphilus]WLR41488.1 flagellar assembly protein FliW [Bacillus carboniphilus]